MTITQIQILVWHLVFSIAYLWMLGESTLLFKSAACRAVTIFAGLDCMADIERMPHH